MYSRHELTLKHLPEGLQEDVYRIADDIFSREINKPLCTDPEDEAFYFTVPEPILEHTPT